MAEPGKTSGIGQRIKELRRRRGYRSTTELAERVLGGNVTAAVLENIESGRKADLSVSQLLNIARALRVPPAYLLADITAPGSSLDLPNLSDDFAEMTAGEFEAWFSGTLAGDYRSPDPDERLDLLQLEAYRTLSRLRREMVRQAAANEALRDQGVSAQGSRSVALEAEAAELEDYLQRAGWTIS
ncbi:helix-turn-helix domain-containing protein [Rathayibacter sp. KR2-224]|uniref:helix-turn-helix domain-containing protein n=1 Tax=Rathayibacter sp. KR2-224 TaxID=3400913 RepID=UPI003BFF39F8